MTTEDIVWALAWFLAGLITFRITSMKNTLTGISAIITVVSILVRITKPDELFRFVASYPIGSALTNFVYLLGANLVRGDQFHTKILWGRILVYGIIIAIVVIFLQIYFPIIIDQQEFPTLP